MTLFEEINSDIKIAMKSKDKEALAILRIVKALLQNEEIAKGSKLNSDEELTVLSREVKQRKEALTEFEKAGRQDLIAQAQNALDIVSKYLPTQLSDEELETLIQNAIDTSGATSMKDFGKVMGIVMPQTKGKADGQKVNALVKQLIS
ncbi:GatB/YqeY domain-containing protein [Vagococcus silagei]|uniref:GatB/YqeY domain-containing protein n=1 Tax=Vagococcus silagei TaxID=2508885 RepID=A0A4S3B3L8_9ENTE|nr:GatB/YqeY domain-containing protein [Vagococcus silagei]THB61671.1 GatB/YqeY domain-containing protein [Vagococcus silagei]